MAAPEERRARLRSARLYLVIEAAPARAVVPEALAGGVDVVQLRDKHAGDDELVEAGRWLRDCGALFVLNDRPDLALDCGADAVHVGQDDMPVGEARALVGPDVLIGLSTHSPARVDAALADPDVDYLGVGPVYETETKPGREAVGLELVRYTAAQAASQAKPWFAIGGIDAERAPHVVDAGARRLAVVRAIRDADDPRAAAALLREATLMERVGGQAQ